MDLRGSMDSARLSHGGIFLHRPGERETVGWESEFDTRRLHGYPLWLYAWYCDCKVEISFDICRVLFSDPLFYKPNLPQPIFVLSCPRYAAAESVF